MKREANVLRLVLMLFFLSGCSYNPFISNNHTTGSPVGAAAGAGVGAGSIAVLGGSKTLMTVGGLGGGALGYYMTTLRYDAGGVIQSGGQVYKVGDFVGINIPSDKLFEPNSAEFLPQAGPILDSAATVLQRYPNNNIIISGNTSGFSRPRWERRLSEARARKVASYLWNAGINNFKGAETDLRTLNYVGYGNYFPIANTYTNDSIRKNSRIQITSFPTYCDLHLDRRHLAMRNMGALDDTEARETMDDCIEKTQKDTDLTDDSYQPDAIVDYKNERG
ncbi:OmpA family protein [Aquicella lusitana]|uniref:Outer membrane protein OmpA-like peptidoglycan-associated protein n=1 Tax=Aquicella lusitana TaxID=254246 RepID=A0A370GLK1_9COXI|nr:OmpA family protein [Aquicella lusitana]RDI44595.1 outer membrane protein OmpA-like peptidoglycan-associated protein [Aquicella lusitana]VVC72463.1 putative lipoprotein YiaD [Aquicella lusitana]